MVGTPTAPVRVFVGLYLLALGSVVLLKTPRPRAAAEEAPAYRAAVANRVEWKRSSMPGVCAPAVSDATRVAT